MYDYGIKKGAFMKKSILSSLVILLISSSTLAESKIGTVLYVGDSHSYGKLGTTIEANLSKVAARVVIQASCGSTPNTWLGKTGYEKTVCGYWKKDGAEEIRSKEHKTPGFKAELLKYAPEITIIQLGTNIAANANPLKSETSVTEMMTLIKEVKSKCFWIGPPDAESKIVSKEKLKKTNEMLRNLASKNDCIYIDSLQLTTFPQNNKEGIHYPPKLSQEWGEKIWSKLSKELIN